MWRFPLSSNTKLRGEKGKFEGTSILMRYDIISPQQWQIIIIIKKERMIQLYTYNNHGSFKIIIISNNNGI